jgi:hypothetical protein
VSAQEIIEQIKALPPDEKAAVADFVRHLDTPSASTPEVSYIDQATVEANADKIFDRYDGLFRKLAK